MLTCKSRDNKKNIMKNFFRKVAFGLKPEEQAPSDPCLKRKELYDGRDLNATIDARSVYASAMSTVFDLDFKRIQKDVFWGEDLQNLSDKLFKV